MRARIPYLSGLARQGVGQPSLRPPHRRDASDVYAPVRSPNRRASTRLHRGEAVISVRSPDAADEQPAPPGVAESKSSRIEDAGRDRDAAPPAIAAPVVPAIPAEVAIGDRTTGPTKSNASTGPDAPGPATVGPKPTPTPSAGSAQAASERDIFAATTTDPAVPRLLPVDPVTQQDSRAESDLAGWMRGSPNPLPHSRAGSPEDAGTSAAARPTVSSRSGESEASHAARPKSESPAPTIAEWGVPVQLPHALVAASDGGTHPAANQTVIPLIADGRDSIGGRPSRAGAAVHELLPPPAAASEAVRQASRRPGGLSRDTGTSPGARVSIGIIEVNVVPPARPAPAVSDASAPGRSPLSGSRVGSMLAAGPGSERLRDGLRRWYGTAQG